eukprot:s4170_g3.t2
MSISVEVGLLSGKRAFVNASLDEEVGTLNLRAQAVLGVRRGRLLDAFGSILDAGAQIKRARVQNGDSLTLHIALPQVCGNEAAFAAILGDGSVVTWGAARAGGDSRAVQDQLRNVQQIQASRFAFAAILGDGSVVTWGAAKDGGDSRAVQDQLRNVQQIQASAFAFAAILGDGSVVTWGDAAMGGDSSAVQDQLRKVQQIQASEAAFAAILCDGSVVTWGHVRSGGDSSAAQDQLKNVQQIQAHAGALAAVLGDGSVVSWGDADCGGDSSAVQHKLKNVQHIQASKYCHCSTSADYAGVFAAILGDGSVVTWGAAWAGGDSRAVQDQLRNVQQIYATEYACAALLGDGSVVTWGAAWAGGDSSAVQDQLRNVLQIQGSTSAFAAILEDGSVVTWGDAEFGGDSSAVQDQLRNVQQIQATVFAFAAVLGDGSVVTWGEAGGGGSRAVQNQLKNVQQIQATRGAFAAMLGDGSVVTWGHPECGGDSSAALVLSGAAAAASATPAQALQKFETDKEELVTAPANEKAGINGYLFTKPAGFKRLANVLDPSGYVFRNTKDTYFTFATRAEARVNASTEFKVEDFIDDYRNKFVNATGSSFALISGGGQPTRVDEGLGIKYYEVEYVVRTQLGFSFDSLKTLHFITTFGVGKALLT